MPDSNGRPPARLSHGETLSRLGFRLQGPAQVARKPQPQWQARIIREPIRPKKPVPVSRGRTRRLVGVLGNLISKFISESSGFRGPDSHTGAAGPGVDRNRILVVRSRAGARIDDCVTARDLGHTYTSCSIKLLSSATTEKAAEAGISKTFS